MEVRILNVMAGIWLFVSAFVWDHASAQRINTATVGVLSTAIAVTAMRIPRFRWLNTLLSAWLFASALILPRHGEFVLWNNMLVAVTIFVAAAVPGFDEEMALHQTSTRRGQSRA